MFDSGASCHMMRNSQVLQEAEKTLPVSIGLPNGTNRIATHQGLVNLGGKLKLNNVLYVPSLQCNLISIARLCNDLRCLVTFSDDACVLQGRTSRTLIGASEQQGGLYYNKEGSLEKKQMNAINNGNMWHKRLGHPSSEVLSLLPSS